MHFFASDHIARAHHSSRFPAACTDPDTPFDSVAKAAAVIRIVKMSFALRMVEVRTKAEVFIDPIRIDDFPRIHFPVRIPSRFELAKGLDQLRTVHLAEELSPGLSVS